MHRFDKSPESFKLNNSSIEAIVSDIRLIFPLISAAVGDSDGSNVCLLCATLTLSEHSKYHHKHNNVYTMDVIYQAVLCCALLALQQAGKFLTGGAVTVIKAVK